jgi:hypothetical protein
MKLEPGAAPTLSHSKDGAPEAPATAYRCWHCGRYPEILGQHFSNRKVYLKTRPGDRCAAILNLHVKDGFR